MTLAALRDFLHPITGIPQDQYDSLLLDDVFGKVVHFNHSCSYGVRKTYTGVIVNLHTDRKGVRHVQVCSGELPFAKYVLLDDVQFEWSAQSRAPITEDRITSAFD